MAIQIKNMAELEAVMMAEVAKAFKSSENDLIDEIKQSIDETVYNYQPVRYERNEDLKNTLEAKTVSTSMVVSHNTDKASWFSVKDGSDRKDIPEIVTYGAYGTYNGYGIDAHGGDYHNINPSSQTWAKPRDYMKHAEEKVEGNGYQFLAGHLPSYATIK